MVLMKQFSKMCERTPQNVKQIPRARDGGKGVYILFDRLMPVYVGKGNIRTRIRKHGVSKRRGRFWDHFSWYIPSNPKIIGELEAVLHQMLPQYPHLLNLRREHFKDKKGKRLKPTKLISG
jgi:hypothetical protein